MSDFGLFEAAVDDEQAPRRRERVAARQMSAALTDVHRQFGPFLANADGPDNFEDRWLMSKKDIFRILQANGVGQYPAIVREVHGSLKSAWYARHGELENPEDRDDDETKPAEERKDDDRTITDHQYKKVKDGDYKSDADDVDSHSGDGSDASGDNPKTHKDSRRRYAEFDEETGDTEDSDFEPGGDSGSDSPGGKEARRRHAEDRDAPTLTPDGDFDSYLSDVDRGGPAKVDAHDFTDGNDTGSDKREAMQLLADLYTDWAQSNNLRVASMNTLDVYAANGLHDDDYYLLASLIRKAECDCEEDCGDDDGPPVDNEAPEDSDDGDAHDGEGGSSDDSDDSDGDTNDDDDAGDESDADDNPFTQDSEEGPSDSDDTGDGTEDANPFAGGDDSAPDDPEASGDDVPPSDDGSDQFGGDQDPSAAGPSDVGPPEAAGQDFTVPEQVPDLPPDQMDQIPPDDTGGEQAVPPEVIDQILGLPPGTLEQLIVEELSGGGGAPPSGPPPQLAARRRRAAEDPTEAAGSDPAAAAQPQMPAAPPAGAGSAGTIPPPGSASVTPPPPPMPLENQPADDALLDTALQAVTQSIDTTTQQYQQVIDPLTQALQAIEFAQQVQTAENPLDVTPPDGSVDVDPSAAPGGADSLGKQARTARINKIAQRYNLTRKAKFLMYEAMSRKHYEHVGEAIRTLPPELRPGIANHIGAMFGEDNPRFNHDKWLESVGAPRTASRRPFVIRSRTSNGGRSAGLDHEAKGVLDMYDSFTKDRTNKGLNMGDAANVDAFEQEKGDQVGPKALTKLKNTISTGRRQASFFTRKVPGWSWDDHLAGYISKEARPFTCSCGNQLPTPSYNICRCGKLWNSYAIGDGNHLAANTADMFIAREIPVRDDVIVANRKMAEDDRGYTVGEPHSPEDTEWVTDAEREHAEAPHAPYESVASRRQACWPGCHEDEAHAKKFHKDNDDEKTAALMGGYGDDGSPPSTHNELSLYERHYNTGLALGLDPNTAHERAVQNAVKAQQKWRGGQGTIPDVRPEHTVAPEGTPVYPHAQMAPVGPNNNDLGPGTSMQAPSLKDQVRNHLVQKMQNGGFAGGRSAGHEFFAQSVTDDHSGWVKYDEEDPSRTGGPKKPPSTSIKGGDPKWHSREPAGKFKSTTPFK